MKKLLMVKRYLNKYHARVKYQGMTEKNSRKQKEKNVELKIENA